MKLHLFKNGIAVLHGLDAARVQTDVSGTLIIGTHEIAVEEGSYVKLPAIEDAYATVRFVAADEKEYRSDGYRTVNGRIVADSRYTARELEFMHRLDELEDTCEKLTERIVDLEDRYSSEILGFLINENE